MSEKKQIICAISLIGITIALMLFTNVEIDIRGYHFSEMTSHDYSKYDRRTLDWPETLADKFKYVLSQGDTVTIFSSEEHPIKDQMLILKNEKYGFTNFKSGLTVRDKYEFLSEFNKGFAIFMNDRKFGVIDELDNVVIQNKYEGLKFLDFSPNTGHFPEGKFKKMELDWWRKLEGVIDFEERVLIPAIHSRINYFLPHQYKGVLWNFFKRKNQSVCYDEKGVKLDNCNF